MDNRELKHPADKPQGQVHIKRALQIPQGFTKLDLLQKGKFSKLSKLLAISPT